MAHLEGRRVGLYLKSVTEVVQYVDSLNGKGMFYRVFN